MRINQCVLGSVLLVPALAGIASATTVTIASGAPSGSGITALAATTAANYGGGAATHFATFTAATFAAANAAPAAAVLTSSLPGSWNNAPNSPTGWTGTNSAAMNAAGARWIHNVANDEVPSGTSVLYAIPFTPTTSVVNISLDFVTDNGLGNTNGANGTPAPSGFANNGLFLNGVGGDLGYSSPGGSGQPAQFSTITHLNYTNKSVIPNTLNYLYFYQFNWGGPGGSGFVFNIEMVPLPPAAWAGMSTLAVVAGLGFIRRRRMMQA